MVQTNGRKHQMIVASHNSSNWFVSFLAELTQLTSISLSISFMKTHLNLSK